MTCRDWLNNNGYKDVVELIDNAIAKMAIRGSKQRRNWWDILSGGADGRPCVREGIEFPLLRVAQIRQGKPITKNAIARNSREQPPDVVATGRWPKDPQLTKSHRSKKDSDSSVESNEPKRRQAS
jgi:hypothetical protein